MRCYSLSSNDCGMLHFTPVALVWKLCLCALLVNCLTVKSFDSCDVSCDIFSFAVANVFETKKLWQHFHEPIIDVKCAVQKNDDFSLPSDCVIFCFAFKFYSLNLNEVRIFGCNDLFSSDISHTEFAPFPVARLSVPNSIGPAMDCWAVISFSGINCGNQIT